MLSESYVLLLKFFFFYAKRLPPIEFNYKGLLNLWVRCWFIKPPSYSTGTKMFYFANTNSSCRLRFCFYLRPSLLNNFLLPLATQFSLFRTTENHAYTGVEQLRLCTGLCSQEFQLPNLSGCIPAEHAPHNHIVHQPRFILVHVTL